MAHFEAHAHLFLQAKMETPSQTPSVMTRCEEMIWFLKSGSPIYSYGAYASTWHLAVLQFRQIRAISNFGSTGDFNTKMKGHLKYCHLMLR